MAMRMEQQGDQDASATVLNSVTIRIADAANNSMMAGIRSIAFVQQQRFCREPPRLWNSRHHQLILLRPITLVA